MLNQLFERKLKKYLIKNILIILLMKFQCFKNILEFFLILFYF